MNHNSRLSEVPVEQIAPNPHQPRRIFDEAALGELADSIRQHGLIQPITVRRTDSGYYLIAGERRLRASMLAGLATVSCVVIEVDDEKSATMALIENLQRENLHYLEEAEGYYNLLNDFGITQEELAKSVGKSQATIANKLRVLRMAPEVKKALLSGGLTERHARALLALPTVEQQLNAINSIVKRRLSVKQTEQLVAQLLENEQSKRRATRSSYVFKDVRIFQNTIRQAVEIMNESGIAATSEQRDAGDHIEYIVRIPKNRQQ